MELLTSNERKLQGIAGCLGILQGTAWVIMSLLGLIFYYKETTTISVNSYFEQVNFLMYSFFLARTDSGFKGQHLKPNVFAGFLWTYFFVDLIWIFISVAILYKNKYIKVKNVAQLWILATLTVCFLDFVLMILLGTDYQECLKVNTYGDTCAKGILPVLIIAAKGFILWIINAIFIGILVKINRQKPTIRTLGPSGPSLDEYPEYNQYPPPSALPFSPNQHRHSDSFRFQRNMKPNYQEPFVLDNPPNRHPPLDRFS